MVISDELKDFSECDTYNNPVTLQPCKEARNKFRVHVVHPLWLKFVQFPSPILTNALT